MLKIRTGAKKNNNIFLIRGENNTINTIADMGSNSFMDQLLMAS